MTVWRIFPNRFTDATLAMGRLWRMGWCCGLVWWAGLYGAGVHAAEPVPVEVGVYINDVTAIDLKSSTASIDLYLWFRTRSKDVDPLETFELVNGRIEEKSSVVKKQYNGIYYSSARIQARVKQHFNLAAFPLDNQRLKLLIEDAQSDINHLVYVPDNSNSKIADGAYLPGWTNGPLELGTTQFEYESNLGDTANNSVVSVYSRAQVTLPMGRSGLGYFFKLFGMVFLSAAVSFLVFFIKPDDLDPRFGLGIGGIFAVIASNYIVSSLLPETHLISMGESLVILTLLMIFVTLLQSVVVLRYHEGGREALARKIDLRFGIGLPLLYVALCVGIVWAYTQT